MTQSRTSNRRNRCIQHCGHSSLPAVLTRAKRIHTCLQCSPSGETNTALSTALYRIFLRSRLEARRPFPSAEPSIASTGPSASAASPSTPSAALSSVWPSILQSGSTTPFPALSSCNAHRCLANLVPRPAAAACPQTHCGQMDMHRGRYCRGRRARESRTSACATVTLTQRMGRRPS